MPFRISSLEGEALPRLSPFLHGAYQFSWQVVEGVRCLFMSCLGETLPAFPYLGRHVAQVERVVNCPVVLSAPALSPRMQQRLVRERLPFVAGNGALYFPFLGAAVAAPRRERHVRMTPLAQLLALWHVYSGEEKFYAHGLAERFGVSLMGISNACAALVGTGVYSREKDGRYVVLHSVKGSGGDLFSALRPFLASPVAEVGYLPRAELPANALVAGESALPLFSRLEPPALPCVAVYRRTYAGASPLRELVDEDTMCRAELWRYDPSLLGKSGAVDPLSLYLSIEDDGDPRMQQALEELLKIFP